MSILKEVQNEQDLKVGEEYRVEVVDIHKLRILSSNALDEGNGFDGKFIGIDSDGDALFDIGDGNRQCIPNEASVWPLANVQVLEKVEA